MRITTRLGMFGCAAAMLVTACGGGSPGDLLAATAGDAVTASDDGVSVSFGEAEVTYGNGDRPDWLPAEFLWPDGIESQYAINDTSTGERAYLGLVPDANVDALRAEQHSQLIAAGYELLGDSDVFISPDGQGVEMQIEESEVGVMVKMSHRSEDLQTLRDAFAPVEGEGTMAVQIDGESHLFTGSCSLRSTSGHFEAESDDLAADRGSISIDIRDGEQNYILADVATFDDETFAAWTMLQQDDAGNFPTMAMTGSGFTVDGFMTNFNDGATSPVQIIVTCPA